jgi:hypothetical protein
MSDSNQNIVKAGFEVLAKSIEPSLFEYTSVSRCQASIQDYLGQYISTFTTELPGAFARNTMVSPLKESIVDMLVLFNQEHSERFLPSELSSKLHVTLRAEYPGTTFDDKTESVYVPIENFTFRVQPGFITEQHHYLVPAPGWDEWVEYDSIGYKNQFSKMNAAHGGKLLHLVRMMKTWNRLSGKTFDGYFLELLVNDVLAGHKVQTYQSAIRHVFRAILSDVGLKQHDPANQSLQVEGLHDIEEVVNAMVLVKNSYLVAKNAIELEEEGKMKEALAAWAQLFPTIIPGSK